LASKPVATVSFILALKLVVVSWLSLKTKVVEGFPAWTSKLAATVWLFEPQNYRDGLLVWASKLSGLRFVSVP
jgi:hypothetical protein